MSSIYLSTNLPAYKPQSPTPDTPPDTPSPKSPTQSDEDPLIPHVRVAGLGMSQSQYTPGTTPDSNPTGPWKQTSSSSYLPMDSAKLHAHSHALSGSPNLSANGTGIGNGVNVNGDSLGAGSSSNLSLGESIARERTSPTRATGLREQQNSPNHFTPAYAPSDKEIESGFAQYQTQHQSQNTLSSGNGLGGAGAGASAGAHTRRQYANVTPTSYTAPMAYPLTRTPSNSGRTEVGSGASTGFYDSPAYWLVLYFFFNLGLTLFNKVVLVSFPFPYVSHAPPVPYQVKPSRITELELELTCPDIDGLACVIGMCGMLLCIREGCFRKSFNYEVFHLVSKLIW